MLIIALIICGIIIIGLWVAWSDEQKDKQKATEKLNRLENDVNQVIQYRSQIDKQLAEIESRNKLLQKYEDELNSLISQRSKGFPLLGDAYAQYVEIQGKILESHLVRKDRPAPKAAEAVKEITKEKRELIKQLKILEFKIKNYELLAPFLTEVEDELTPEDDAWILSDYSEEELQDEVIKFLTKEEYRKLTVSERNQLALDRYWTRSKKSKWLIGKMYEHYIGYLYERDGWSVEYFGINERYEDLGRDLIATKGKQVHIVQCKNWSRFKTIYENHIFQLFGTAFEYQKLHSDMKVTPVFFSSTHLSDAAVEFAKRLDMQVRANIKLEKYPCIKCNINKKDGTKIYHLPFDQLYDRVMIEPNKGEFYCEAVVEAESKGFRRAYRWSGAKSN